MNIKFLDLTPTPEFRDRLAYAYARVINSGRYIGGEEVEAFEEEWARYIGAQYCVSCGNGFDALVLALKAHGIGDGCQVAVPSETCLPTWSAVEATGAIVRPCDIDLYSNPNVDAIIPVHLYGVPVDIQHLPNVILIEDAAQAHGSLYPDGTKVGSKNLTAWSFYPTKNLGCYGDGGAITTNDEHIARYLRELRNYGGNHVRHGINSRLDTLQAAFLRVKLPYLDRWNARRREIADKYIDGIKWVFSTTSVAQHPFFIHWIPTSHTGYKTTNFHQFVIQSDMRDDLALFLHANGVETMIHYPKPPHRHACFSAYKNSCPNADEWSKTVLSLPIAPYLTDEQVEYIISKVNEWIAKCQSK